MKFLDSKEISEEKDNLKVTFKPVTPDDQAVILGYQGAIAKAIKKSDEGKNIQAQMRTAAYALGNMINKVTVDGEVLDHEKAAECADLSDQATVNILLNIYRMTVDLLVEGSTKKKSSLQRKPTKKE
jgi:hypothetical protein